MTNSSATPPKTKARVMRELLNGKRPVVSCGVYDGYSALMVQFMGFSCAATTGAGLANSVLGVPDIGIFSLRDNVDTVRNIARSVNIPVMADADTGYGNAVTVYHVVQYFEEAGVVGINIEDQVMPKRCGHMRGKEIVSAREMAQKIEAAVRAKQDADFIINARTDALAIEGVEGTVARVREYVAAGADMIYPDAIRSEDDVARVVEAANGTPVSINMGFGLRARPTSPLISLKRLAELGVARVSLPRFLPAAALHGMQRNRRTDRPTRPAGRHGHDHQPDELRTHRRTRAIFSHRRRGHAQVRRRGPRLRRARQEVSNPCGQWPEGSQEPGRQSGPEARLLLVQIISSQGRTTKISPKKYSNPKISP